MPFTTFFNAQLCVDGQLVEDRIVVSSETGRIVDKHSGSFIGGDAVDLEEKIIAPGYLELHTNGMNGVHFSNFSNVEDYQRGLEDVAQFLVTKGVTGFWATLPTVPEQQYKKILPSLKPREFPNAASLLGAHVEGPFLAPSKKGAHAAELFRRPETSNFESVYGVNSLQSSVRLATLAPELGGSNALISSLVSTYNIKVSMGHSEATYAEGQEALSKGASCLTHVFNAMQPLHHREPGLAGLVSAPNQQPFYSVIPDGVHLSPAVLNMVYRANPNRCILITDSIELAGLPDGVYPGNAQIPHNQVKKGNKVVIEGADTLIGSCLTLDQGVQNLRTWSGCSLSQAVKCVTQTVADFMGLEDRGCLNPGQRADFVVLDEKGEVNETWIAGRKVWNNAYQ